MHAHNSTTNGNGIMSSYTLFSLVLYFEEFLNNLNLKIQKWNRNHGHELQVQIIEFKRLIQFDRLNSIQSNQNQLIFFFFHFGWIWYPHNFIIIIIICQSVRVNCNFFSTNIFCHQKWEKYYRLILPLTSDGGRRSETERESAKSQMKFDQWTKYQFAHQTDRHSWIWNERNDRIFSFFARNSGSVVHHYSYFKRLFCDVCKRQTLSTQCKTLHESRKIKNLLLCFDVWVNYTQAHTCKHNIPIISMRERHHRHAIVNVIEDWEAR